MRTKAGFPHPYGKPNFHLLNPAQKFEEEQKYDKMNFESQNDQQQKTVLHQMLSDSSNNRKRKLGLMDEVYSVYENISGLILNIENAESPKTVTDQ